MSEQRPLRFVDLFCGAGGTSTGAMEAAKDMQRDVEAVVVNHWGTAIETHKTNHPEATHLNAKVEELHPPDALPWDGIDVDLLVASPECTHFSTARGGKPVNEQQRASPWHVLDWLEKLDVENILLENVREFQKWGPIDEDGVPSRDGTIFEAWINALHALGYSVDWRVLNAADYGDATSRKRLFVVGRKGQRASFPDPTHSENGDAPGTDPWRPASEVIDWSDPGESIWSRSRPLVNNTMQRIAEGIRRHCADDLEPFADAVAELGKDDVEAMQDDIVDAADLDTAVENRDGPFLVRGPVTVDSSGCDCTPYVLGQHGGSTTRDVCESPLPTIATRGAIGLYAPETFVLPRNGAHRGLHSNATYDLEARPLHTVTAKNHDGHLVSPLMMRFSHSGALLDLDEPLPTITTARCGDFALARPFLVEYYGNGQAQPIDEPLPTVTTKDRFALIVPECLPYGLDIRFRMLQPRELAAAMGFPDDYEIVGNKTETTKQIGNAVPVNLAKSLVTELLTGEEPSLQTFDEELLPDVAADGGEADD